MNPRAPSARHSLFWSTRFLETVGRRGVARERRVPERLNLLGVLSRERICLHDDFLIAETKSSHALSLESFAETRLAERAFEHGQGEAW